MDGLAALPAVALAKEGARRPLVEALLVFSAGFDVL